MNTESPAPVLLSVKTFAQKHDAFPEGGLRHLLFNADCNGLAQSGALIRVGRKVLIHEQRFFAWLDSQQGKCFDGTEHAPARTRPR